MYVFGDKKCQILFCQSFHSYLLCFYLPTVRTLLRDVDHMRLASLPKNQPKCNDFPADHCEETEQSECGWNNSTEYEHLYCGRSLAAMAISRRSCTAELLIIMKYLQLLRRIYSFAMLLHNFVWAIVFSMDDEEQRAECSAMRQLRYITPHQCMWIAKLHTKHRSTKRLLLFIECLLLLSNKYCNYAQWITNKNSTVWGN